LTKKSKIFLKFPKISQIGQIGPIKTSPLIISQNFWIFQQISLNFIAT
jgi:hypothetical protein